MPPGAADAHANWTPPDRELPLSSRVYYGVGSVAFGIKDNGFSFFLLLYYGQVVGLPERWVGAGILLALLIDAITDPMVGHWSDHLRSRWGRRHPFLYASAVPIAAAWILLWNPPRGWGDEATFGWFVVFAVLVRVLITLYEIPSTSLVAELTSDYDERTRVLSLRYFFGWWGGLTMAVVAYTLLLEPSAADPSGVLDAEGWRRYGVVSAGLMIAATLISALGTHRHIPELPPAPPPRPFAVGTVLSDLRLALRNRSFLALFVSATFAAMAGGLNAALNIYFNTYYWGLTTSQIALLAMAAFGSAGIALVIAPRIAAALGKKRAAIGISAAAFLLSPLPILLRLLGLFPANGDPLLLPILFVFTLVDVALLIAASIFVSSMVADVVEDHERTTGKRSEGVFFAVRSFVGKSVSGIGVFASTILLTLAGFPENAAPGEVSEAALTRLAILYLPLLGSLYLVAIAAIAWYGIDRDTHRDNLDRLRGAADAGRAAAEVPIDG